MSLDSLGPPKRLSNAQLISPVRVLYEYDGPAIFTAMIGLSEFLFYKADELEECDVFIAAETDDSTVDLVMSGRLSVRGALDKNKVFIIELNHGYVVEKYWDVIYEQVPEGIMPPKHVPIFSNLGTAVDHIEQARSFFSIRFEGSSITRSSIPFGTFKSLVDSAYEASKRLLMPDTLSGFKTDIFDFPISEPAFSSLTLSLDEPTFNMPRLERELGDEVNIESIRSEFRTQKDDFFAEMNDVMSSVQQNSIKHTIGDHFVIVENIKNLIPTESNKISSVEFVSQSLGKSSSVTISEMAGESLDKALKIAERTEVADVGRIQIINERSGTFVILSDRGRQVKCSGTYTDFAALLRNPLFRPGSRASVRGLYRRRKKRDEIVLRGVPEISTPKSHQSIFD